MPLSHTALLWGAAAVCISALLSVHKSALVDQLPRSVLALAALAALYAPFYFDRSEYSHGTRYWEPVAAFIRPRLLILFRHIGLSPSVILKDPNSFKGCKQAIFGSHPHGVMSFHHALFYMHVEGAEPLIEAIPLSQRRALAARSLFGIPIFRDFVLMAGAVDASAPVASKCLSKGFSLTVLPGGEQEQLLAEKDEHVIYIKARKGFCKLAVKHNVPVIPAYCFGETSTFWTSSFLLPQRKWLAKMFFIAIPISWGRSLWNPLLPLQAALTHCVGAPIPVPPIDENADVDLDFRRRVDLLHSQYIDALINLFEENKAVCGHPDSILHVI